jgi:hypothetical protein
MLLLVTGITEFLIYIEGFATSRPLRQVGIALGSPQSKYFTVRGQFYFSRLPKY